MNASGLLRKNTQSDWQAMDRAVYDKRINIIMGVSLRRRTYLCQLREWVVITQSRLAYRAGFAIGFCTFLKDDRKGLLLLLIS